MRASKRQRRQQTAARRAVRASLDVECLACGCIHPVTSEQIIKGVWRCCPNCGANCDVLGDEPPGGNERNLYAD